MQILPRNSPYIISSWYQTRIYSFSRLSSVISINFWHESIFRNIGRHLGRKCSWDTSPTNRVGDMVTWASSERSPSDVTSANRTLVAPSQSLSGMSETSNRTGYMAMLNYASSLPGWIYRPESTGLKYSIQFQGRGSRPSWQELVLCIFSVYCALQILVKLNWHGKKRGPQQVTLLAMWQWFEADISMFWPCFDCQITQNPKSI